VEDCERGGRKRKGRKGEESDLVDGDGVRYICTYINHKVMLSFSALRDLLSFHGLPDPLNDERRHISQTLVG